MRRIEKGSALLASAAIFGIITMSGTTVEAKDIIVPISATVTTSILEAVAPLAYGDIDLVPGGDEITMNCADAAESKGQDGSLSSLNGSGVDATKLGGTVTVTSDLGTDFEIAITYPADDAVALAGPGAAAPTMRNVETNSGDGAGGAISHVGDTDTVIHIGGTLVFPADADQGAYSADMTLVFDYT